MALATLSIDLVAQLGRLQQGMDKAASIAQRSADQIERKFAALNKVASTVGAALGTAFAGAGLTALLRSTVDGIDKLNDLADATGASIGNLSALEDAAARTGTGIDVVGDALIKLNKVLGEAKPGSEQANVLKAIGLGAEELRKLDPAEALQRTAQALAGFQDDGNKARIVQELFGKSIREVGPLLKDLAEQGQLNASVTEEQAAAADKFNKEFFQLQKLFTDLARDAAGPLVETLNAFSDALKGSDTAMGGLSGTAQVLAIPLQALTVLGANVAFVFKGVGTEIGAIAAQAAALARGDFAGFRAIRDAAVADAEEARRRLDEFEKRILGGGTSRSQRDLLRSIEGATVIGRRSLPGLPGATPGRKGATLNVAETPPEALAGALKFIDEADENKVKALREQLAELVRLVTEGTKVPDTAFAKLAEDLAKVDPAAKAAAEEMERVKRETDEARRIFDETRTPSERLAAELDKLNKLLQAGRLDWDTYARAVFDAQEAFDKSLKPAVEEVSEFAKEAQRNIQDALGNSILASMEGNAKSIEDIWKNMLKRMVAEAAAARLAESLFGKGFGSSTGSLGGFFGSAVNFFTGLLGGGSGGVGGSSGAGGGVQKGGAPTTLSKGGVVQNVYVQGDVGAKARQALLGVAAQLQARQQRTAAI